MVEGMTALLIICAAVGFVVLCVLIGFAIVIFETIFFGDEQ